MKTRGTIVAARERHIPAIAVNVRPEDRAELWAAGCIGPAEAMEKSLARSSCAWTGFVEGVPVAMFGVCPGSIITGTGIPWMIGTNLLDRHARTLMVRSKRHIQRMAQGFDRLENYVDSRNVKAVRWLAWLGFTILDPVPMGPFGVPFHRFIMKGRG
jgi:hypothetical protein